MTEQSRILEELNDRSREVFRRVVEGYLDSGAPVGSRTLTRTLSEQVSAATVRNVMQDLEFLGLLGSPHACRAGSDAAGPSPVRGWVS
jgi:heat-inducible transcriptional repressor